MIIKVFAWSIFVVGAIIIVLGLIDFLFYGGKFSRLSFFRKMMPLGLWMLFLAACFALLLSTKVK